MTTKSESQDGPNEVTAALTFTRGSESFSSPSTEVEESASKQRINFRATMNRFSPFRVYFINFSVLKGLEKGTYELGESDDRVTASFSSSEYPSTTYLAWRGNVKFENAPTLTDLEGTFEFEAKSEAPQRPETATLKHGIFSLHNGVTNSSLGSLNVDAFIDTVPPNAGAEQQVSFKSTSIDMRNTPDRFLEVVAFDKNNSAYVYLNIPKGKLDEKRLDIGAEEDGANAIVHFRKGPYFERGTTGSINIDFNHSSQTLIADFSYADEYGNQFKQGHVQVTGLSTK
ncbi:hypothetical protein [Pseudomonas proteolytica]|jgi:hypothetical protein|uniref:hypothetical protein n=1 Tax=Pseudomonas proteolytica TaxID=219574 RepID=UPI00147395C5|nr:hypothetical protein [Pseudomonas proteolytica]MDF3159540.1 hypothetical protein [Pseudomonas proteolytica]NMZ32955.1 hypothetical protein [Pseudomonas proteolytica]